MIFARDRHQLLPISSVEAFTEIASLGAHGLGSELLDLGNDSGPEVDNALGQSSTARYFYNLGLLSTSRDVNNQPTSRTYDELGRVKTVAYPDGGSAGYTYDAAAGFVESRFALDASRTVVSRRVFDGLGRPCETQQFLNGGAGGALIRTRTEIDGGGRAWRTTNPYSMGSAPSRCSPQAGEIYTIQTFDGLDRVKSITAPDGSTTQIAVAGSKTTTTDPDAVKKETVIDALGRLDRVTEDPGGSKTFTTYYQYDALANLTGVCPGSAFSGVTCSNGRKRAFVYDSLSRLRKTQNPETGSSAWASYEYDNNGNPTFRSDTRSITTTYSYDVLNRLTTKNYSTQGAPVNLCYDSGTACGGVAAANALGRLISVSNDISVSRNNNYDAMGRVTSTSMTITGEQPFSFTSYGSNLAGNLTSMIYPSGRTVQTDYDGAGRSYKVRQGTTPYAEVGTFTAHGAIAILKLGWNAAAGAEVMTETWSYNNRLQPMETRVNLRNSSANLTKLEYFYCAGQAPGCTTNNGNMRSQRIGNDAVGPEAAWERTQTYGYDKINRLTTFEESGATETNDYDAYGNRWATQSGFPTSDPLTPTHAGWFSGADNRMTAVGYDGGGNQTQVNPYTLSYDAENRVKTATSASNGSAQYWYDGDGRRVKKLTCTGTAACTDSTAGVLKTLYVYDAFGQLTAEYSATAQAAGTQYLTADHLGSTRLVTDGAGGVVRRHDYRPFGQDLSGVNGRSAKYVDTRNALRFTGKERDNETGLDYFGARYMSPAQGRFTTPDKLNATDDRLLVPSSFNTYAYAANNPLRFKDPDGRDVVALLEPPNGVMPGHFMLFANNPSNGKSAMMSFGPIDTSAGTRAIQVLGGPVGSTATFAWPKSADELRQNYAALSIQTSPGQAQDVINFINQFSTSLSTDHLYRLYSTNFTTVCRDALKAIGILPWNYGSITPFGLWTDLYGRVSNPAMQRFSTTNMRYGEQSQTLRIDSRQGADYGSPRFGMNTFDFIMLMLRPREEVKSKICYTGEDGKQVCQ